MTKSVTTSDRNVLNYRPKIAFVEPELKAEVPVTPLPEAVNPVQAQEKWDILDRMAIAGRILAEAFQQKVDDQVGDFYVSLDESFDSAAVDAMKRKYASQLDRKQKGVDLGEGVDLGDGLGLGKVAPKSIDPRKITYQQYKECRENMSNHADEVARNMGPDDDVIKQIRSNPTITQISLFGIDSIEGKSGLLRPELDKKGWVIPPLNLPEIQNDLICRLMNLLWKLFIRPILCTLIPPPLNELIPDEIC
jgi:hypothetical protein